MFQEKMMRFAYYLLAMLASMAVNRGKIVPNAIFAMPS